MKYHTSKIILVVQDLKTKGGEKVAVVSGDVHYHTSLEDKARYIDLQSEILEEKNDDKKALLQNDLLKLKKVASFQMTLESSKELQRVVNDLVLQAIQLKENNGKEKN